MVAELRDVSVRRGRRWIVRHAELELPAGALAAIIGPNGSGKSTLARMLAGQMWPTEGAALLHTGEALVPAATAQQSVRIVQPAAPLDFDPRLSAREIVFTGFFSTLALYDRPTNAMRRRADTLLGAMGMAPVADSPYGVLSTGEKVRTLIARALAVRPRLLILDEPTSGLDLLARERVLASVRKILGRRGNETAVLFITHHVEELLPETQHVLVISRGRTIASGPPRQVLSSAVLSQAYGVAVEVHRHHERYYTTVHADAWQTL